MQIKKLLDEASTLNKRAVIFKEREVSFKELTLRSFEVASFILSLKITPLKIALYFPNNIEAIFFYLGSFLSKGVVIPLDYMLTEEELIKFLNHCQATILIAHLKKDINFPTIKNKVSSLERIIFADKISLRGTEIINSFPEANESDTAAIFYTSGSTGEEKGVMLTYDNLDNPYQVAEYFLEIKNNDILICPGVPFSHIGGLDYLLLMLQFKLTLILQERFHPFNFLKEAEKYKATFTWLLPSMYLAVLSLKDYKRFKLENLRYAIVFGAPSSPHLIEKFKEIAPSVRLLNGWGMTETTAPNCVLPPASNNIKSIGKFSPFMEAKVVDRQGKTVSAFQKGELLVRGKGLMKGYYKNDSLNSLCFTKDGWFKTGDIAYYDQEGFFYIVGRIKEMIKVGGEIVYLSEIEEKIKLYPGVKEVAVIGIKDKLRGEVPCAFVSASNNLDEQDLRDFLKRHLAHFKLPHYFEFVKELPRTRIGKVDKEKLKMTSTVS